MDLITVSNSDIMTGGADLNRTGTSTNNDVTNDDVIFTEATTTETEKSNRKNAPTSSSKNRTTTDNIGSINLFTSDRKPKKNITESNNDSESVKSDKKSAKKTTTDNLNSTSQITIESFTEKSDAMARVSNSEKKMTTTEKKTTTNTEKKTTSGNKPSTSNKTTTESKTSDISLTPFTESNKKSQKGAGFEDDIPVSNVTGDDRTIQKLNEVINRTNALVGGYKKSKKTYDNNISLSMNDDDDISEHTEATPRTTNSVSGGGKSDTIGTVTVSTVTGKVTKEGDETPTVDINKKKKTYKIKKNDDDLFTVSG